MELSFLFSALVGGILGFLSGLGVGGGSLLILWLTLVENHSQPEARTINLMFFIPAALIALIFHCRKGTVSVKKLLPAMGAGCLGALAFGWLGEALDLELMKKGFGILLLFTGFRELAYRPREFK